MSGDITTRWSDFVIIKTCEIIRAGGGIDRLVEALPFIRRNDDYRDLYEKVSELIAIGCKDEDIVRSWRVLFRAWGT